MEMTEDSKCLQRLNVREEKERTNKREILLLKK
jgi:hypothetical protein